MALSDPDLAAIIQHLRATGIATAADLAHATGRSQPSVSRRLRDLADRVAVLGRGRRARYGLAAPILGLPSLQPIFWTDTSGRIERVGTLQYLSGDWLHVEIDQLSIATRATLPWMLAPLRLQGFLGRARAHSLAALGFDRDPERWSLEQQLHVIVRHVSQPPGAISIGDPLESIRTVVPANQKRRLTAYEQVAGDVTKTLPAGSSAAGEQAKFLAEIDGPDGDGSNGDEPEGRHVLVKFAPPRDTPFGERWNDLLHAEALALPVLAGHDIGAATARVLATAQRTLLESKRFDRIGTRGARHVVALDAIHEAFVPGPRQHWAATCDVLARSNRLPEEDARRVRLLRSFGRLIGNTDMHFGNLSLFVERHDLGRGRFRLAPVYDMLPMRWRPDPVAGTLDDLPFEPESIDLQGEARRWAVELWDAVATHADISRRFRALARAMRQRLDQAR